MVLEFTNTLEDYVEGNHAHAAGPTLKVTGFRFQRGLIGWVLFIGLAIGLFVMLRNNQVAPPPAPVPPPVVAAPARPGSFVRVLLPLVPWLLIFFVIWAIVFWQLRRKQHQP